jgi:hypothetical protein
MNQNAKKQLVHPWAINAENYQAIKRDRRNIVAKEFTGQNRRKNEKKIPSAN